MTIPDYVSSAKIDAFIDQAFVEDLGDGDHSSLSCIPAHAEKEAFMLMKSSGTVAGLALVKPIFKKLDPEMTFDLRFKDGDLVKQDDILLSMKGKVRAILAGERLVLNCLQRMSGIATQVAKLQSIIAHTDAKLLDTRKTTPNLRMLEKWAVHIGGGQNHRFGLFDMIMLKDNHIDFAGGITPAIEAAKAYVARLNKKLKIEVETRNLSEVEETLAVGGVDRIMLDNMSIEDMREAVLLIKKRAETEASGGITEKTIREIAETGVNYISVGALTHSYQSLDISLKAR